MTQGLCIAPGCFKGAIGAARSRKHCRTHYRSEVLADVDLVEATVIADGVDPRGTPAAVADALTGEDVTLGNVVRLDPAETNILALIQGGIVELVAGPGADAFKAALLRG